MNTDKFLLRDAAEVIKVLRSDNQFLKTRLSGFDDALRLMNAGGHSNNGLMAPMMPDVVYQLEKRAEQLENREKAPQVEPD